MRCLSFRKGADIYKYLGVLLCEHLDMNFAVNELTQSASCALSTLNPKFLNGGGMGYDVFCKLYESFVEPALLYGLSTFMGHGKTLRMLSHRETRAGRIVRINRK